MQKIKTKNFLAEFGPALGVAALCLGLSAVWLVYFSSAVQVKPMLEQPGAVPFYQTRSASPDPEFGMSLGNTLLRMPDDELTARLKDVKALGVDWLRMDFGWDDIQPVNAARYDWAGHDRLVHAAQDHGLKVLGILAYTPSWARDPACESVSPTPALKQKCAPQSAAEFAKFASAAAGRYPTVGAWEIWNEPNSLGFWRQAFADGRVGVDPVAYAKLAQQSAAAIKKKNPQAYVVTGGLAHIVNDDDPKGMPTDEFLQTALPVLDPMAVDAIGVHPYTAPALPISPQEWNAYYTLTEGNSLRGMLAKAGWGEHQLWATEFGATTVGSKPTARPASTQPRLDFVSEELQADILQKGIIAWCRKPQVGPLFTYTDSDKYLKSATGNEAGFGLRRQDGSPKPAWEATRAAITTAKQNCK